MRKDLIGSYQVSENFDVSTARKAFVVHRFKIYIVNRKCFDVSLNDKFRKKDFSTVDYIWNVIVDVRH